jgi:beta-galactosidase
MLKHAILCVFVAAGCDVVTPRIATSAEVISAAGVRARELLALDRGWRFHLGDVPFPKIEGHQNSYDNAKTGVAWGAAAPRYDDSKWRVVDLPHDWAVEGPFDRNANISQGYRSRGFGWYRRRFKLDERDRDRHIELRFDGVATHCVVWVNGVLAHRNACGYTSFYIDITPFARFGDEVNTIAVRVDAESQEGWWYEGAGIYRHVWLVKRAPVHIVTDGVFANPVRDEQGSWSIPVEIRLYSCAAANMDAEVASTLVDPDGKKVADGAGRVSIKPFEASVIKYDIPVESPRLWSIDLPTLYEVRTVVRQAGSESDSVLSRCGFRTIRFEPDTGFYLNDQPLKIKGTCNHQDHAGVGVAVPDSLWEFRIRRLKQMGSNAYRCAHNPPAAELLDVCDRLGMLVMDENRIFNTTPEYVRQLRWLVRRDRNHPSVILWSVFNEEPLQGTDQGYEMTRRLIAIVKQLDRTRPVTSAQSGGILNRTNASLATDVTGINYRHEDYDRYHEAYPRKPITSSEDTSAVMTRGEYFTDKRGQAVLDSYDTQFQSWGATHRRAWKMIAERPFLAGGFAWTGFDYRGEPQPLEWPATGSSFGIMDLCGFPKTAYYIRQALWINDKPILHMIPHWNWPGREGQLIKVMAITNADNVALSLNGKPIGEKRVDKYEMVTWDVPYSPGKLEAVAFKEGAEVGRHIVETAGPPVALRLVADRPTLAGDGTDSQPVTVEAVDAQGRVVPTATMLAEFAVSGPGTIIGVGNGDPNDHDPEKSNRRRLFNGLAQVILQSAPSSSGRLILHATADRLVPGDLIVVVQAAQARPESPPR